MSDLHINRIHYCPLLQAITLICGTLISFIVAYSKNDVSLYLPFISETGAYSPEKCIFSLSLIMGSFLGTVSYCCFFILIRENKQSESIMFSRLNVGASCIGYLSMLGLAGVAAFPMTTVFWLHLVFAAMYFVGSAVYFILVSFITYKINGLSKLFILRGILSIFITIFLLFIVILFPLSLVEWHKNNDVIPALKTPQNKGFTLLILSSLLEWLIVIVIVIYNLSLMIELKRYILKIAVAPVSDKSVSDVTGPTAAQD